MDYIIGPDGNWVDQHKDARLRLEYLETQKRLRDEMEFVKNDFGLYVRRVFATVKPAEKFVHNWHLDCICEHLEAARRGEIRRLIINVCPRSLKSIITSIAFPSWLLGHNPSIQVMCASYAEKLAHKFSTETRQVMNSPWYQELFPETRITKDQNEKWKFVTTGNGHRVAVSVGSMATGEGGDYLITDDPLNPEQAASDVERETANTWFGQTFMTRLNDKNTGVSIVIMQRLHEDDLTGHQLAKGGWEHLCLPAINQGPKKIFHIGKFHKEWGQDELLDPIRLSPKVLEEQKRELREYGFSGQYMQDPSPSEGGILKKRWWRKWEKQKLNRKTGDMMADLPPFELIIQTYDTAFEEEEINDPSARTTWGVFMSREGDKLFYNLMLLEAWEERVGFPELKEEVIGSYAKWKPDYIMVEKKASGHSLIQELRKLPRVNVRALRVSKSNGKVVRANAAAPVLAGGAVWYVPGRKWADRVINQCAAFPNAKHDDLTDTVVHTLLILRHGGNLEIPEDEAEDDDGRAKKKKEKRKLYG